MVQRLFLLAGGETPFGPIEAALDLGWIKKRATRVSEWPLLSDFFQLFYGR